MVLWLWNWHIALVLGNRLSVCIVFLSANGPWICSSLPHDRHLHSNCVADAAVCVFPKDASDQLWSGSSAPGAPDRNDRAHAGL